MPCGISWESFPVCNRFLLPAAWLTYLVCIAENAWLSEQWSKTVCTFDELCTLPAFRKISPGFLRRSTSNNCHSVINMNCILSWTFSIESHDNLISSFLNKYFAVGWYNVPLGSVIARGYVYLSVHLETKNNGTWRYSYSTEVVFGVFFFSSL